MKRVAVEFQAAYDLPTLTLARRALTLNPETGDIRLEDRFEFAGEPLEIEEAFLTWKTVETHGNAATIRGETSSLTLTILEPAGAAFTATSLADECQRNHRPGVLTRIAATLPAGVTTFAMQISPKN